jgi:hypothetical protein
MCKFPAALIVSRGMESALQIHIRIVSTTSE